jgi:hypothetical protein
MPLLCWTLFLFYCFTVGGQDNKFGLGYLSVTIANNWENQRIKRKGLFKLGAFEVFEVSFHDQLIILVLGLWRGSASWQGAHSRTKPVASQLDVKKRMRLGSCYPLWRHSPKAWKTSHEAPPPKVYTTFQYHQLEGQTITTWAFREHLRFKLLQTPSKLPVSLQHEVNQYGNFTSLNGTREDSDRCTLPEM